MHFARIPSVDAQGLAADGSKTLAAASPELLAQIFKSEVGDEGDPFPTSDGHYYAIKVDGVTPPKLKPLEAVRDQALALWTAEQQVAQLKAKAATLVAKANVSHSLDDIAKSLGVSVQASPALTRGTDTPVFGKALILSLFNAAPGATVSGPTPGGGYVIARITGIHHPAPPSDNLGYLKGVRQLSTEIASDFTTTLAKAEQAHEGLTINHKLFDSTVGNSGSGS
jgi:peptidyl-prolyl cis-trans isomerase D